MSAESSLPVYQLRTVPRTEIQPSYSSVVGIEAKAERLFQLYLEARDRAEASRNFADGRAAGIAWRRFMDCYMPSDKRMGDA